MNVCGGHERTITMAGLRAVLPAGIELVPGPGCPVCVCPEEAVSPRHRDRAHGPRHPGDVRRHAARAGQRAEGRAALAGGRARGRRRHPRRSPRPRKPSPSPRHSRLARWCSSPPDSRPRSPRSPPCWPRACRTISVLLAGRRTWPAVAMLLDSGQPGFDGLIAPGHVATVMGPEEWDFVPRTHGIADRDRRLHHRSLSGRAVCRAAADRRRRPAAWTTATRNWCAPAATPPPAG